MSSSSMPDREAPGGGLADDRLHPLEAGSGGRERHLGPLDVDGQLEIGQGQREQLGRQRQRADNRCTAEVLQHRERRERRAAVAVSFSPPGTA